LKSRITSGDTDDASKAVTLAKLTAAYPAKGQDQVSSDLRIEAYFEALDDLPAWAAEEARLAIVRGRTDYGKPWGPGPTEFAELVKLVLAPMQRDLGDVEALLIAAPGDEVIVGKYAGKSSEKIFSEFPT